MLIDVVVVPNSPKFKVARKDSMIKIYLTSPPEENKANIELLRELENLFGKPVALVSGAKSRRKKIELQISEEEWERFISGA